MVSAKTHEAEWPNGLLPRFIERELGGAMGREIKKRFVLVLPGLVVLSCLWLAGCGGSSGSATQAATSQPSAAITVVLSPSSAVVQVGATQQFNATVSNATTTAVTWSVNGVAGGNTTLGKISDAGFYTAPATVPNPATVTITATSQQDSSKTGTATVTIVSSGSGANNALLNGRYAFIFFGSEKSNGVFVAGGTFLADGNGNITDGREDGNFAGGIFTEQPFTGSYSIGADRRGTMMIANSAAGCGCAPTSFTFKFNVVSDNLTNFIEFDSTSAGKGTIAKQDTAAFSLATLDGPYAFLVDGLDFNNRLSIAGRFTSSSGALSAGISDINNGPTVSLAQPLSGTLTLGANGRGTLTLTTAIGPLHFAYYIVSSSELLVVGTDFFPILSGTALRQTSAPFANASLFGQYIFGMTASTHDRPQKVIRADAGFFQADGAGQLSNGVLDRNSSSGVLNGSSVGGTYSITPDGRGTATLSTQVGAESIAFYLTSNNQGFILQVDSSTTVNNVTSGTFLRQDTTSFSVTSWQGPYGLFVTGSSSATDPINVSGILTADGVSALSTVQDIYDGSLHPDVSAAGSYGVQSTGRGTAAFPSMQTNFNVYLASGSYIFLIGMDPGQVRFGTALKQQ
jgi:hypothetical protein